MVGHPRTFRFQRFPLNCVSLRSELDDEVTCGAVKGQDEPLIRILQAIEPHLSLQQTLYSWNQIAQALAEKSRNRLLQLAKSHPS